MNKLEVSVAGSDMRQVFGTYLRGAWSIVVQVQTDVIRQFTRALTARLTLKVTVFGIPKEPVWNAELITSRFERI
ncbi:hypothetical protein TNCV_4870761 [Trichonephila clavipes]|nr:hypothetical protein TNCV_4870761 [Trichonephila clavipes]